MTAQRHCVSIDRKMSEQSLPDGFRELPAEEQRRIRESGRAILDLAYRHTGYIIISSTPAAREGVKSFVDSWVVN